MKKTLLLIAVAVIVVVCLSVGIIHSCNSDSDQTNVTYVVAFEENGGTSVADIEVEAGRTIPQSEVATSEREGYAFAGWYATEDLSGKPWNFTTGKVTKDITLFAKWTAKQYTLTIDIPQNTAYTITARRGNELLGSGAKVTVEDIIVLELTPVGDAQLPGKLVVRGASNLFDLTDNVLSKVAEDVTVSYTELAEGEYWITYRGVRGVKHDNPETYFADKEVVLSAPENREGYTFAGWYIGEEKVESISGRTGDLTVTAKWDPITYKVTYENVEGAVNENPDTYSIETTVPLTAAEKDGYEFLGWFCEGKKILSFEGRTGNLTLTAQWGPERAKSMFALHNMTQSGDDFHTGSQFGWKYARTKKNYTYTKFEIQTTITPSAENAAMGFYIGQGNDGFIMEFSGWADSIMYIYVNDAWDGEGEARGMTLKPLLGKALPRLQPDVPVTVKMQYDRGLVKIYWMVDGQWDLVLAGDAIAAANKNNQGVTFDASEPVRAGVAAWQTESDAGKFEDVKVNNWDGSIVQYSIAYKGVEGVTHSNPHTYIEEGAASIILMNPSSKPGQKFLGWYIGEEQITSLAGCTGNLTITAKWRALEEGELNYTLNNMTEADGVFTTGTEWGWKYASTEDTFDKAEIEMTVTPTADNGAFGFFIGQGNNGTLLQFSGWTDERMYTQVNGNWEPQMDDNGMWLFPLQDCKLLKPQKDVPFTVKLQYDNGFVNVYEKVDGQWVLCLIGDAFGAANNNTQGVVFDRSEPICIGVGAWQDYDSAAVFTDVKVSDWDGSIVGHSITYQGVEGVTHTNPTTYIESIAHTITLTNPSNKDGYKFLGWFVGDEQITTLDGQTTDLVITAKWRALEDGEHNYTLNNMTEVDGVFTTGAEWGWKYAKTEQTYESFEIEMTVTPTADNGAMGFYIGQGSDGILLQFSAWNGSVMYTQVNNTWEPNMDADGMLMEPLSGQTLPRPQKDVTFTVKLQYYDGFVNVFHKIDGAWVLCLVGDAVGAANKNTQSVVFDRTQPMFAGVGAWQDDNSAAVFTDVKITPWDPDVEYTITYEGVDGMTHTNPAIYTPATAKDIVLSAPVGETELDFIGWYIGDTQITTLMGLSGDITLTAKWYDRWYTTQNMDTVTDHADGSVSVYAANNTPGNIKYLLTKQSGTSIVAEATFRYSDWFYHGGFALNDGTNTMYFAFRAGQDISGSIPIGFNNNVWSNYLDDIDPKVNTIWTDSNPSTPDPVIKARLVYENSWAQLYLWNEELQTWSQWSCKVNVGTREGTRYAGTVENVLDTTKPMHVGVAFDGADGGINGGGYVDNFSYTIE